MEHELQHRPTFALLTVTLESGEQLVADAGALLSHEAGMDFDLEMVGGLTSTMFSGERLVSRFTGPGTVWLQSRSQDAFISWLVPMLPNTSTGSGGPTSTWGTRG